MRVGVFDSGVGGLSVLKSVLEARLFAEVIYYGDTARVPYGPKDKATIERFSLEALDFFKPHQIDLLIVACNTVSAWALPAMREQATMPIVGVIEPGVLAITQSTPKNASILVLGTKATISSGRYERELKAHGYTSIKSLATGLFVPLIEEGILQGPLLEACMHHYFQDLQNAPDVVVLGCTHFPLIISSLQDYFTRHFKHPCQFVHSGNAIVQYLQEHHHLSPLPSPPQVRFFASGDIVALKTQAKAWLGLAN
ncbi:glutamate racemase [Helicobacter bizzozeronii CIII-1]|uniref:Glutamate racemase n=1 Tax=Helicobacter bizzozeronii (strain CIII-1) TaxID=1002804 RepID=F8KTV5_HELBC|nr:glutamate racemase [Helicobacter bizzozeronii]CCB80278.1 glutamate racemase [Helicobacter bizzozeronii CIII-1]